MAFKETKRKGFNFFRSYYDVYNELESDKDKIAFIEALLDRQFLFIKPTNLNGMAKFAYISQVNSIDSQVKGYEDKIKGLKKNITPPTEPPTQGGELPPTEQVEVKEKVKGKVKEEILNAQSWLESILIKRIITLDKGVKYLKTFLDLQEDLTGEGNGLNRDINEIKNHFVKWLDIEIKKEKEKPKAKGGYQI